MTAPLKWHLPIGGDEQRIVGIKPPAGQLWQRVAESQYPVRLHDTLTPGDATVHRDVTQFPSVHTGARVR